MINLCNEIFFYFIKKEKISNTKNAVRLQRRNLEIFLEGFSLKIDFLHDFSNFRMCEINYFYQPTQKKEKK